MESDAIPCSREYSQEVVKNRRGATYDSYGVLKYSFEKKVMIKVISNLGY
jgi:hypothetical protein